MQSDLQAYDEALACYRRGCELMEKLKRSHDAKDEAAEIAHTRELARLVRTGVYEHFKSTGDHPMLYAVTGVHVEPDTLVAIVTYTFLYGPRVGLSTHRPLLDEADGFLSPVARTAEPAYHGPRFRRIYSVGLQSLQVIISYAGETAMAGSRTRMIAHVASLVGLPLRL